MELEQNHEHDKSTGMIASMNEQNEKQIITIGSFLKKARQDKSLSLDAISRHTKISNTNLEALESDNKKALPNIAYVKGFVKAYSKIIDVDVEYTLSLLENLYHTGAKAKHKSLAVTPSTHDHKIPASNTTVAKKSSEFQINKDLRLKLFGATAAIAIIGLIFFSRESREVIDIENEITTESVSAHSPLTTEAEAPAKLETEEVAAVNEEIQESSIVANTAIEVKAVAPEKKELAKVLEPIKEATDKKVEESVKEVANEKKSDINFYNFSFPIYTIVENSAEAKTHIPASQVSVNEEGQQNVFITATEGDTWITYKKNKDDVKKFVLKQGRYLTIRGEEVRLFLGNANAVKIFLNNKLVDINTTSGVKSLVFPEINAKKLKLPLFIFNKDGSVTPSDEYQAQAN